MNRWGGAVAIALMFVVCALPVIARQTPQSIEAFVAKEAADRQFSGTVLIARQGSIVALRSFGLADRSFTVPARPTDRYRIASITKTFTATIVMMLVDEGKLRLDTRVGDVLPDYPGQGADRVTIRTLLNHTSGLAQYDRIKNLDQALTQGVPQYQRPQTSRSLLIECCSGALVHDPGTTFDYNNADYLLLGRIIERLDGKSFAASLADRIIRPLALAGTGIAKHARIIPRLTPTYYWRGEKDGWMNDLPTYYENSDAAGGMYSTATDLALFADALFGGRLIRSNSLAEMLRPGLDDYGFGLWSYTFTAYGRTWRVAKRPGSIMGANTQLYRLLDSDVTIVLLANTNRADLDSMVQAIGKRMTAQ